jgi:hypothetical protein
MTTEAKWVERVSAWRGSGLSAPAFCAGKEFTPSGLRYWSSRLRREPPAVADVRMARVVRSRGEEVPDIDTPIVVEVGGARVAVRRGFDRATLLRLLEVIGELGGAR